MLLIKNGNIHDAVHEKPYIADILVEDGKIAAVGENLAATGAIKDLVVDSERIALAIVNRLRRLYPELLYARYKIESKEEYLLYDDYDFFRLIGKKRGFLISGGEIDEERCAKMLIEEFRSCKIGKISLEHI